MRQLAHCSQDALFECETLQRQGALVAHGVITSAVEHLVPATAETEGATSLIQASVRRRNAKAYVAALKAGQQAVDRHDHLSARAAFLEAFALSGEAAAG